MLKKLIRPVLVIAVILLLIGLSFGAVKANDYWQVRSLIKSAETLTSQEKYQEAIDKLNVARSRWSPSFTKTIIGLQTDANKRLLDDQSNFNYAKLLFDQSKWSEAKETYLKVSNKSPYFKESQDKIGECQKKIDEAKAQEEQKSQSVSRTNRVPETSVSQSSAESTQERLANAQLEDMRKCKEAKKEALEKLSADLDLQIDAALNLGQMDAFNRISQIKQQQMNFIIQICPY